ncbi:hypothetical protein FNH09_11205 [Streptomyces adustus]|uniref:Transposase n=1 Tax=Streptomyces adustus TaxID=1609272 RepID=A0A5N8VCS3_9ACTN|nr:hypothetical protein [Streptomyces adustus]
MFADDRPTPWARTDAENFFAERAQYPRCKSRKKSRASAEWTRRAFTWRGRRLTLAKSTGPLDIRWSRHLPQRAQPSAVTVSHDSAGRWFVSLLWETDLSFMLEYPCAWNGRNLVVADR